MSPLRSGPGPQASRGTSLHDWLTPNVVRPVYERLTGRRPWTDTDQLRMLQWRTPAELEARAVVHLRSLLARAAHRVPHYRGGVPFTFVTNQAEEDEWAGVAPGDTRVHIASRPGGPRRGDARSGRAARLVRWALLGETSVLLPGIDLTARRLATWVAAHPGRYYVVAYPAFAVRLARDLLDAGDALARPPEVVVCGGESLSAPNAELVSRGFGCRTVNRYSASEAAFLAQTCPDNPAVLHVNSERAILRVVRPDGSAAFPGQEGRVIVTNLGNRVMPFVNYDIGDWAVAGHSCPCGRGFPTLEGIEGRLAELIETPAGRIVSPTGLCHFLVKDHGIAPHVRDFQALHGPGDLVTLHVVPTARYTVAYAEELRAALEGFLGPGMAARVETVDTIPSEASGKRLVIKKAGP